jgi:hypothetical protein
MNLEVHVRKWSGRAAGDLEWDSVSGRLAGSLADLVARSIEEARLAGSIGWGPESCLVHAISDPLHDPAEFNLNQLLFPGE